MKKLPFPILISGKNGSGKSTLAKRLAKKYHADYISASDLHQKMIQEKLHLQSKKINEAFWETKTAKLGTALRKKNPAMDRKVDRALLAHLRKKKNIVTDARLMPWLFRGKAIRIWLESSTHETAKRVAERDRISVASAKQSLVARFKSDRSLFYKLYRVRYGKDFTCFDFILNNDSLTAGKTYQQVDRFIQSHILTQKMK